MSIEKMPADQIENQVETAEQKTLLELGHQFSDFQKEKQAEIIKALKTIGIATRADLSSASFDEVLSSLDLEEMEKGIPNTPKIPDGVTESLYLLNGRENGNVGKLPFSKVKEYLEGQL